MSSLRVLHTVSRLSVGGINSFLLQTLPHMPEGQEVGCVTLDLQRFDEYEAIGIRPHSLGHTGWSSAPRTLRRAVSMLRSRKIDVIHAHQELDWFYFGIAARICRVPLVVSLHALSEPSWKGTLLSLPAMRHASHVHAVSEAALNAGREHFQLDGKVASIISPGVQPRHPLSRVERQRLRDELGLVESWPILISVGRLVPGKDVLELVRMMEEVVEDAPSAHLLIAGDGELRSDLDRRVNSSRVAEHISVLGNRSDVESLLSLADVFVSASGSEGFGLAALEAVATGVPAVGLDLQILRRFPAAGALVRSTDELATAVLEVARDHRDGSQLETLAQIQAHLDPSNVAQGLGEIYARVAAG